MKKISQWIFFMAGVFVLTGHLIDLPLLNTAGKPLLMVALSAFYFFSVKNTSVSAIVLLAFAFSWIGDILLMVENNELFFMFGLASFLLAHVAYFFAYRQHRSRESKGNVLEGIHKVRFAFPVVLIGAGLVTILYPHLGPMRMPVIIYSFVLVVMVLSALFRYGYTSTFSFTLVVFGALAFMTSDALLAINKFLTPIYGAGFLIMLTYMVAQYCIAYGLVRHVEDS